MKTLVTYQSKTGFTKKYAEWISEALEADLTEISEARKTDISQYDLVIHGGWIMGGMINGLDRLREMSPKKMLVFGVGFTAKEEVELSKCIEINKLETIPFFYFEGGMNPKKMGFAGRMMVKMVTKKTPEYCDNTERNAIIELVNTAKTMQAGAVS